MYVCMRFARTFGGGSTDEAVVAGGGEAGVKEGSDGAGSGSSSLSRDLLIAEWDDPSD